MEGRSYQVIPIGAGDRVQVILWEGLGAGSLGQPVHVAFFADKTVQVTGIFGSGEEVVIEGTVCPELAGASWEPLSDRSGAPLVFSLPRLCGVGAEVSFLRPRVKGGSGDTRLSVYLLVGVRR